MFNDGRFCALSGRGDVLNLFVSYILAGRGDAVDATDDS